MTEKAGREGEAGKTAASRRSSGEGVPGPRYNPAFQEFFRSEDALVDFLNAVLRLEGGGKIRTPRSGWRSPAVPRPRARDVLLRHPRDDGRREGGGRGDAARGPPRVRRADIALQRVP